MLSKGLILVIMIAILVTLAQGVYFLIVDHDQHSRLAAALSWRIGLSWLLFVLLLLGFSFGVLTPHGL